jgi:Flp pilus assembly protein TadG
MIIFLRLKMLRGLRRFRSEEGSGLVELALVLPLLLLILTEAVDYGHAYTLAIEVTAAAEAGALYGALNVTGVTGSTASATLDSNMLKAAKLDAKEISSLSGSTAINGCECSDGGSVVTNCTSTPSCLVNVVNFVEVNTQATYVPILSFPGIPTSIVLKGKSRLRAAH